MFALADELAALTRRMVARPRFLPLRLSGVPESSGRSSRRANRIQPTEPYLDVVPTGAVLVHQKTRTPRSGASEALADLAFAFQQIVIAIASAGSITVAHLRSVDRGLRSRSSERSRVSLKMRVQRNAVAQEEPLDSGQQQSPDRGEPKQIVYDADPYAHLTAGERYTLAIQRRDALLAARSRSSC